MVQVVRVNMDVRQIDLGLVEILERSGKACTDRGAAARAETRSRRRKQRPAGARGIRREKAEVSRYDFWSSEALPSFIPSLKFLIALPMPRPS